MSNYYNLCLIILFSRCDLLHFVSTHCYAYVRILQLAVCDVVGQLAVGWIYCAELAGQIDLCLVLGLVLANDTL